jgi:hypothetical protein
MLIRTTVALALILASASGSLAAQKRHSTNTAYDVYDTRGHYVGVNRHPIGTPDRHPKGTPPFYVLSD